MEFDGLKESAMRLLRFSHAAGCMAHDIELDSSELLRRDARVDFGNRLEALSAEEKKMVVRDIPLEDARAGLDESGVELLMRALEQNARDARYALEQRALRAQALPPILPRAKGEVISLASFRKHA